MDSHISSLALLMAISAVARTDPIVRYDWLTQGGVR